MSPVMLAIVSLNHEIRHLNQRQCYNYRNHSTRI